MATTNKFTTSFGLPILLLMGITLVIHVVGVGVKIARLCFIDGHGFVRGEDFPWQLLNHWGEIPAYLLAIAAFIVIVAGLFVPTVKIDRLSFFPVSKIPQMIFILTLTLTLTFGGGNIAHSSSIPNGYTRGEGMLNQNSPMTCRSRNQKLFRWLDQDGDNAVSLDDLECLGLKLAVMSGYAPFRSNASKEFVRSYRAMDTNFDNRIELEEFLANHCRFVADK